MMVHRDTLLRFLSSTSDDLLSRLAGLPGAIRGKATGKVRNNGYAYLAGTLPPEKRALLVAHVDTVSMTQLTRPQIVESGDIIHAGGRVLGADDRAGVLATWMMRKSGHSILWTDGEESGGRGAERAADEVVGLEDHTCAIEIDRAGDQCLAFYHDATCGAWEDFLAGALPEWNQECGTYTDIATICPAVGICGVNFAAGYMFQHSTKEVLYVSALERSILAVAQLISGPIPRLAPDIRPVTPDYRVAWWEAGFRVGSNLYLCPACGADHPDPKCSECRDELVWGDLLRGSRWNAAGDKIPS